MPRLHAPSLPSAVCAHPRKSGKKSNAREAPEVLSFEERSKLDFAQQENPKGIFF
jgi:hypothetical protein